MISEERRCLPCPICQVVDTEPEFPDARGPAREFPLVRCRRCGLVFQRFERGMEELDDAQSEAYGVPQRRFRGLIEWGVRLFREARVRLAARLMPPGGHVLDIGCGRAFFLRRLHDRGFEVLGTELSAATAANADPKVPIDVGELEPGRYPEDSFDLISIWHVLEHLQHPDRTLEACARALRPGGVLMIAVPNYGSAQAAFGGESWFHLDLPRHVFHFTDATLSELLVRSGFTIETLRTGQWEMDPFGWVQTALNRFGLRHGALYDTLRNHASASRDLGGAYRALLVGLFPLGMLLALPLSLLQRMRGRAGTLIVVARKPARSEGHSKETTKREARDHGGSKEDP
ncbi:MAG: class I SAM-dependent methyltransferase [Myxococcota bacterium]